MNNFVVEMLAEQKKVELQRSSGTRDWFAILRKAR